MIVVSDTSPINYIVKIDQLTLLKKLFGEIIIPHEVYYELLKYNETARALNQVSVQSFISVQQIELPSALPELLKDLDKGEQEAILLAKQLNADILLIDEISGREAAKKFQLRVVGLLGVLELAKAQGYIAEIKPLLKTLVEVHGFWINNDLVTEVLRKAKEF
jgi:predicted nucleic acid-binding protein